jgi:hypothetical protein
VVKDLRNQVEALDKKLDRLSWTKNSKLFYA